MFDELAPPYGTIVADPPWRYQVARAPTRGHDPISADAHYQTMTMREIAALPVADLAGRDTHLYLWVTNPRMFGDHAGDDRFGPADILEAWGFEYKTMLTWVKTGCMGLGYWFRGATEHILFATRPGAKAIPPAKRATNLITAQKRGHSVKPGAFYDRVEAVSPGPYLEMFARSPRLGWDGWGYGWET